MKKKLISILLILICTSLQNVESQNRIKNNNKGKSINNIKKMAVERKTINGRKKSHLEFGKPFDKDSSDDFIINRQQYTLSYNKYFNVCNWVSWNLNKHWYGNAPRFSGNFVSDSTIPIAWYHVKHSDYTNSGYDRGHMVRSEERTKNDEDNLSTFYLTNVIPQTADLNRGPWLQLESYCEELCKKSNKELYVVSGGIFHSNTTLKKQGKVRVPDSCFKIVVVLENSQGLKYINVNTSIIAVVMPNIKGIRKENWNNYISTVDKIESSTGYNFLHLIDDKIEKTIESKKFNFSTKKKSKK